MMMVLMMLLKGILMVVMMMGVRLGVQADERVNDWGPGGYLPAPLPAP